MAPRLFFEDIDEFVTVGTNAGAEGDHEVSGLVTDVKGCVDDSFGDKDGVARAKNFFLAFDPLFDGSLDAGDGFFLVRMFMKVVAFAGEELDIDNGEMLAASGGGTANPSEFSPVQFFGGCF